MHKELEEFVDARYLELCSAQAAYDWLSSISRPRPDGADRRNSIGGLLMLEGEWDWTAGREYALLQRNDPLIDYGLARYGLTCAIADKLFDRLSQRDRLVMRSCHAGGGGPLGPLDAEGDEATQQMAFLSSNPYVPDTVLKQFFERSGPFQRIDDAKFQTALKVAAHNPRVHDDSDRPRDEKHKQGDDYHPMLRAAWELANKVPVDKKWSRVLWEFLDKLEPTGFEGRADAIARWKTDDDVKDPTYEPSFQIRRLLARWYKDGLESNDLAVRLGSLSTISPHDHKDWEHFAVDGIQSAYQLIANNNLWMWRHDREKLKELVLAVARDHSNHRVWEAFEAKEASHKIDHPDWFKPLFGEVA